jgi:hypothetical protein
LAVSYNSRKSYSALLTNPLPATKHASDKDKTAPSRLLLVTSP